MTLHTRVTCRACAGALYPLLDLGFMIPSTFLKPDEPDPLGIPLTVVTCDACGLVQLKHTVDPDLLYREYWYRSGINETMRAELADIVDKAQEVLERPLAESDEVLDIGANDGTLLSCYPVGPLRIAFEPAYNLQQLLASVANVQYPSFFPGEASRRLSAKSITIATSIAMFYDLEDPKAFVAEIDRLLTDDGVWVVQFQDLAQMVETCAFDNVVAEHLCYYSLRSFRHLLIGVDLEIAKVERRAINGGSLRVYVRRSSYSQAVDDTERVWWDWESTRVHPDRLEKFAWQVGETRSQIQAVVAAAVQQYGFIDLYAASTKSSTLLQYCGIDRTQIRRAAERTPEKVGLVTSGTRIPIVSEETWREDHPAAATLIGAWQFTDAFVQREVDYVREAAFIVPLPYPRLVTGRGGL